MRTICRVCELDIHEEDEGWTHVHYDPNHEATPIGSNQWPTENVIGPFEGEHRYLSNFYPAGIRFDGTEFPTSEHAYQAAKARGDGDLFDEIARAESPDEAKELGRRASLPDDWEERKKYEMLEVVTAKFAQNPGLGGELVDTGDETLVELNWWNDTYWGADIETGEGLNMLGRILMRVRSTLRAIRL